MVFHVLGKTTLISLLAGGWRKSQSAGDLDGTVTVNGKPPSKRMNRFIALIAQDDLLFANLTVEQTLRYAALLNLPKELTREQKLERVERVISVLGLNKCRGTKIGGGFQRGVSGGERKRCSVANELLMNPSIVLADEMTSGLDSTTSSRLVSTFRSLARGGRAVVCTIHQPSSQIFDLFDKVLLLAQGRTVYYGSTQTVTAYFDSVGLMCKPVSDIHTTFHSIQSTPTGSPC
jgi:ABC-type multidrug transport system ATPase subunit